MEFVEGEALDNLVKRWGRLEVNLALEVATQVAAGLTAIHNEKLVHRDIKPTNIIVSFDERQMVTAKIIDLGLAKPAPDTSLNLRYQRPGLLRERRSLQVRSNLQGSAWTSAQIYTR
jgi:serine/threonine protein kinase